MCEVEDTRGYGLDPTGLGRGFEHSGAPNMTAAAANGRYSNLAYGSEDAHDMQQQQEYMYSTGHHPYHHQPQEEDPQQPGGEEGGFFTGYDDDISLAQMASDLGSAGVGAAVAAPPAAALYFTEGAAAAAADVALYPEDYPPIGGGVDEVQGSFVDPMPSSVEMYEALGPMPKFQEPAPNYGLAPTERRSIERVPQQPIRAQARYAPAAPAAPARPVRSLPPSRSSSTVNMRPAQAAAAPLPQRPAATAGTIVPVKQAQAPMAIVPAPAPAEVAVTKATGFALGDISSFDVSTGQDTKEVSVTFLAFWRGSLDQFESNPPLTSFLLSDDTLKAITKKAVENTLSPEKKLAFGNSFDLGHTLLRKLKVGGAVQNTLAKSFAVVADSEHDDLNTRSRGTDGAGYMYLINSGTNDHLKMVTVVDNTETVQSEMFLQYGHASANRIMAYEVDLSGEEEKGLAGIKADSALVRSLREGRNLEKLKEHVGNSWDGTVVRRHHRKSGEPFLYLPPDVAVAALSLYNERHKSAFRLSDFAQKPLTLSLRPMFTDRFTQLDTTVGYADSDNASLRRVGTVSFEITMVICFPESLNETRYVSHSSASQEKTVAELFRDALVSKAAAKK